MLRISRRRASAVVVLAAATASVTTALSSNASASVWSGNGGNPNFSTPGNWDSAPTTGSPLIFGGSINLNPFNDIAAGTVFGGITFNAGAGAFAITGNDLSPG